EAFRHPVHLGRLNEQDNRMRIDKALDQPRTGDAIDLRPRARDPNRSAFRVAFRKLCRVDQRMAARRPRLEAAFEVLGGDAFVAKPGGDAFAELGAALATDNDLSAGEVAGPGGDRSEVAPDRSRDQTGIGGEILIVANVYDRRRAGKADET